MYNLIKSKLTFAYYQCQEKDPYDSTSGTSPVPLPSNSLPTAGTPILSL